MKTSVNFSINVIVPPTFLCKIGFPNVSFGNPTFDLSIICPLPTLWRRTPALPARRCTIPAARVRTPLPDLLPGQGVPQDVAHVAVGAVGGHGALGVDHILRGEGEDPTPTEEQYAICVTKGQDELLAAINEVLAGLGEDGVNELVMKHMGLE